MVAPAARMTARVPDESMPGSTPCRVAAPTPASPNETSRAARAEAKRAAKVRPRMSSVTVACRWVNPVT